MVGGAPLYRLPLDGLIISDICPTANGRIFFSADDSLFELEYFVSNKLKKMQLKFYRRRDGLALVAIAKRQTIQSDWSIILFQCSRSFIQKVLYRLSGFQSDFLLDSIFQLVVDDSRHLLFVLMKSGCIQVTIKL